MTRREVGGLFAGFKEWIRVKGAPGSEESSLREGEEMGRS